MDRHYMEQRWPPFSESSQGLGPGMSRGLSQGLSQDLNQGLTQGMSQGLSRPKATPFKFTTTGNNKSLEEICKMRSQFERYGFVVVEELLWPEECDELRQAAYELADTLLKEAKTKLVFSTKSEAQLKHEYFVESNDKVRAFLEEGALDELGNFNVDPKYSLNKIGHALHLLHPLFRCYTYCDRVKTKCKMLGLMKPTVVQSMIVFKNPGVGSEVQPHQDATYLFAEPVPTVGFWIALEDATIENGCLWIVSGSHKSGVHRRLIKNPLRNSPDKLVYDKPNPTYPASSFKPVPVKKGTCIILHGHVVHKSEMNKSNKPRPAYTFHIIEKMKNRYSIDNWLQEGPAAPFADMYNVRQIVFDEDSEAQNAATSSDWQNVAGSSSEYHPY